MHRHVEYFRNCFAFIARFERLAIVAASLADVAGHVYIG